MTTTEKKAECEKCFERPHHQYGVMELDQDPVAGPSRAAGKDQVFPALPEELIKLILEYACKPASQPRPSDEDGQDGAKASQAENQGDALIDVNTARTIATVSQGAHTLVAPILYGNVSLTKPSHLVKFADTLLRRPELGLLVRNLWVGNLQAPSPVHLLPPFVFRDTSFAQSARAHLQRRAGDYNTSASLDPNNEASSGMPARAAHTECPDFVYLERGCDYAAMNVSGPERRIVVPRRSEDGSRDTTCNDLISDNSSEDEHVHAQSRSSTMYIMTDFRDTGLLHVRPGLGIDKQWGFDAAGTWIGSDKWLLRGIELQSVLEFHFEWTLVTAYLTRGESDDNTKATLQGKDEHARRADPLDWEDTITYPEPLPSEEARREREMSQSSTSTAADRRSNVSRFGFRHIDRFFALRRKGCTPRQAARILLRRLWARHALQGENATMEEVCNIDLLSDESALDDFLSPALFAQSGATHLLVHTNPPEGDHAPPDAVPAQVFADSHTARRRRRRRRGESREGAQANGAGDTSDSESDHALDARTRRRIDSRNTVDLVDVFGHVENRSRTLQLGNRSSERRDRSTRAALPNGDLTDANADAFGTTLRPNATNGMGIHASQTSEVHLRDRLPSSITIETPQTLGSLIAKLRAILAFCPHIRVLGLNGFLERAVAGNRGCPPLPKLRHLSLGPPPPYWSLPLNFDQHVLASLRSLHVSGCMLYRSEVMAIGGYVPTVLPRLRDFTWTLWAEHALDHPITVVGALGGLLGTDGALFSRGQREDGAQRRTRTSTPSTHNPASLRVPTPCERPLRRVRVCLNETDVANWRQQAPEHLRDDPRLTLTSCSPDVGSNLQSVRAWWEDKAGI